MGTAQYAGLGMQAQQQAYQVLNSGMSGISGLTNTTNTANWSTTATIDSSYLYYNWGQGFPSMATRMLKFFRVNEAVEIEEGAIKDPLDELRLKVMRWLDGAKVTV